MKKILIGFSYLFTLLTLSFVSCSKESKEVVEAPFLNVSDYTGEIAELPRLYKSDQHFIGSIKAEYNVNSQLTYTLKDENPKGALKIGEYGEILINTLAYFDYEIFPVISAKVDVANGDITKTVNITINLRDIDEFGYFVYKDEKYDMGNMKELYSSFNTKLMIVSKGIDFYNDTGLKGYGNLLTFNFRLEDFDKDLEVNEGVVLFDENDPKQRNNYVYIGFQKTFNFRWSYDDLIRKEIRKGKLYYKRSPVKNKYEGERDTYAFNIDFFFYLTDGTVISGGYEGKGISR